MTYRINVQQRQLAKLIAQVTLAGMDRPELHTELELAMRDLWLIEQFHDWHRAGSLKNIITSNTLVMERLQQMLKPND